MRVGYIPFVSDERLRKVYVRELQKQDSRQVYEETKENSRIGLEAMLACCEEGDEIIVPSATRLEMGTKEFACFLDRARKKKVVLISAFDALKSDSAHEVFALHMLVSFSEFEKEIKALIDSLMEVEE